MKSFLSTSAIVLVLVLGSVGGALADCRECGCRKCVKKVCRVECGTEEEKVNCYSCECKDICIPGPSCKIGCVCEPDPCHPCEKNRRILWKPGCAEVRTVSVLVKKEVKVKVPTYKWTVEEVCCGCNRVCRTIEAPNETAAKQLANVPAEAGDEEQPVQKVVWFSKLFTK